MNYSRRDLLRLLGPGLIAGISGCNSLPFGNDSGTVPITLVNNQNTPHQATLSITTIPDEGGGFTNYFTGTWLVTPNSEHTFEEELKFTDFEPELMALVMLDDETRMRADFSFSYDLTALRIVITRDGIQIQPRK